MKTFLILSVVLLVSCNNPTETKNDSDSSLNSECFNSIFKHLNLGNISVVHVEYYKSLYSTSSGKTVTITNTDTIKKVTDLLKVLPDTGEIMVKFGSEISLNKLTFVDSDAKSGTVIIVGNRIKTPATTFYQPMRNEEAALINLVIDSGIQKSLQYIDSSVINTERASLCRIDFQSGFHSSFTILRIDNNIYLEDTLLTNDVLSLAKQVSVSISKGMHTIKCTIDGSFTADTVINIPDSLVIGIRVDPQHKKPEFNLYKTGNFPYYD
jgi:hypothetical protein